MKKFAALPASTEKVASTIVDAAFRVHKTLGPGLLESVYERCLRHELELRGTPYRNQVVVPINYEGLRFETELRLDLIVADCVIVEIKAVEVLRPVYKAQLLTYLRLTKLRLGLLINFNSAVIRDGVRRVIN